MTSPYLPDDCIYYILKYIQPYRYRSTLFSCLLVNRFWCKATVPLLYADPFLHDNSRTSASNKKFYSIILTFILCLNKIEILQLKNQLKLKNIINDEHKPLFEYPKYLKIFDYIRINICTLLWLRLNLPVFSQYDVLPVFYQSILNQCNNIKQLKIPLLALFNWNVRTIKTTISNLANLDSLILDLKGTDNEISGEFLKNIGNICLNLRKFEISPSFYSSINANDFKENLCKIIQKQNNLEIIKLSTYCQNFLDDIFLSLEFQKHSLVDVEFTSIDFSNISFKNFINLCNLKYLKFNSCNRRGAINISLDKYEILKYASFKLKGLEFNKNNSLITSLMIKYLVMQELKLHSKLNIDIIENISTYCLNLITLEIRIDQNIDLLILPYFKNLRIRTLIIYSWGNIDDMIFKNLANNLSVNIKEVSFPIYQRSHFKEFLENCHDFLEVIGINSPIESALLEIILDYIERGSDNLKYLGIAKLEKELDDEESKLLNQINAKGVKIVNFCNICKPLCSIF